VLRGPLRGRRVQGGSGRHDFHKKGSFYRGAKRGGENEGGERLLVLPGGVVFKRKRFQLEGRRSGRGRSRSGWISAGMVEKGNRFAKDKTEKNLL